MADALDRVLACIEARREDAVELLQELVRVNSVNPEFAGVSREDVIGGETRANEILRERYEQAGLETHWVAPDPERRNLVGIRKGRNGSGRSLALNGHVDTVPPVDPDSWVNGSPWNPEIRDDRLYGIGSTDMKGSDAAMWLVAQALTDAGIELEGDLLLHSVVGEETMQHELGTSAVLEAGFTADAAIVTEPTSIPHPLTVSPDRRGQLVLPHPRRGPGHPLRQPGARDPPRRPRRRDRRQCAREGRQDRRRAAGARAAVGADEEPPVLHARLLLAAPRRVPCRPGARHPLLLPTSCRGRVLALVPARRDRRRGEGADRGARADRLPPRLVAARSSAALRRGSTTGPQPRPHGSIRWYRRWLGRTSASAGRRSRHRARSIRSPSARRPTRRSTRLAGIPSVVFGPGDLRIAHCKDESVMLPEMVAAAKSLAAAVTEWCGVAA